MEETRIVLYLNKLGGLTVLVDSGNGLPGVDLTREQSIKLALEIINWTPPMVTHDGTSPKS